MDGLEKITARISADADAEIQAIRDKAQAQAEELLAQARAQAEKEKGELLARGRRSAEERKARLISAAQMEGRKMSLAAKQEVLDEAFRQALEEMCSLPEEQYIQLLARLAVQASSPGREQLIWPAGGAGREVDGRGKRRGRLRRCVYLPVSGGSGGRCGVCRSTPRQGAALRRPDAAGHG